MKFTRRDWVLVGVAVAAAAAVLTFASLRGIVAAEPDKPIGPPAPRGR